MNREVMIVAGEASGDLHGANLVRAMKKSRSDLLFFGMGGEELIQSGVEVLYDAEKIAVVGIVEVLSHIKDIIKAQRLLRKALRERKPGLLIVIDLPEFNLMLAKVAKQNNIPVFYYISPQVWAWRSGRVKTISERVDTLGVILPFEERFYRERGVAATYVGHPLLDSVIVTLSRDEFCGRYGLPREKRIVGLLPGSRRKELSKLLPIFLEAAHRLQRSSDEELLFLIPLASTLTQKDLLENGLSGYESSLDVRVIEGDRYELMASCDGVVAASGTVTLELALLDVPMVVVYKVSKNTYFLGKLLVKIKYFSLVNLIADESVVTELLQHEVQPETIEEELRSLLFDRNRRAEMKKKYSRLREILGGSGASETAAKLALQTLSG